jgi:hypothetical protein
MLAVHRTKHIILTGNRHLGQGNPAIFRGFAARAAMGIILTREADLARNPGNGFFSTPYSVEPRRAMRTLSAAALALISCSRSLFALDCNGNGQEDALDIANGQSHDCNLNSVPDECDLKPTFELVLAGSYALSARPTSLVAADFNADGREDLAVAKEDPGSLCILLNEGSGTFRAPAELSAGEGNCFVAAGDLNGDGNLDLVLVNAPQRRVSILFGEGDGTFSPGEALHVGNVDCCVTITDLNGDGSMDLVLAVITGEGLFIFLNNGDGTFFLVRPVPGGQGPPCAKTAEVQPDLDGNGEADRAVLDPDRNRLLVFLNQSIPPASKDLNQDGIPDECGPAIFHRGDSSGDGEINISDAVFVLVFLFRGGPSPSCVEAGDANNDGGVDLADPVSILNFLFRGGPAPALPGPTNMPCARDPDPPGSPGDLGCKSYDRC